MKPKPPSTSKTVLSGVVFEFTESSGTRYLFPRKSILEYVHGTNEVIVSFLITRRGNAEFGDKYDEDQEYYTPVNAKLIADSPRLLEILAKVVEPPDEVRKYMTEVMEKSELAGEIYLASQLPIKRESRVNGASAQKAAEHDVSSRYEAPNSLIPLQISG